MVTKLNYASSIEKYLHELRLLQALAEVLAYSMESPYGFYLGKQHTTLFLELASRLKVLEQGLSEFVMDNETKEVLI